MSMPFKKYYHTVTFTGLATLRSAPKPDARCAAHIEVLMGGIICPSCQGTNRNPIPTKEVIQREDSHETLA